MPIYKYKCTECDYEFEALQTMKEKPLTLCPECLSEESLEKCISMKQIICHQIQEIIPKTLLKNITRKH